MLLAYLGYSSTPVSQLIQSTSMSYRWVKFLEFNPWGLNSRPSTSNGKSKSIQTFLEKSRAKSRIEHQYSLLMKQNASNTPHCCWSKNPPIWKVIIPAVMIAVIAVTVAVIAVTVAVIAAMQLSGVLTILTWWLYRVVTLQQQHCHGKFDCQSKAQPDDQF